MDSAWTGHLTLQLKCCRCRCRCRLINNRQWPASSPPPSSTITLNAATRVRSISLPDWTLKCPSSSFQIFFCSDFTSLHLGRLFLLSRGENVCSEVGHHHHHHHHDHRLWWWWWWWRWALLCKGMSAGRLSWQFTVFLLYFLLLLLLLIAVSWLAAAFFFYSLLLSCFLKLCKSIAESPSIALDLPLLMPARVTTAVITALCSS